MTGLTPTELAAIVGLPRRTVIDLCMRLGLPIFQGRIDRDAFLASLNGYADGWTWALMDSTGNLIDSYATAVEAANAFDAVIAADVENGRHVALIAYDKDGQPVDDIGGSRAPRTVSA